MTGKQIANAINKIIRGLNPKDFKGEAINWGDLSVSQVAIIETIYPEYDKGYCVWIEEAAPGCWKFNEAVAIRFLDLYKIAVVIKTE